APRQHTARKALVIDCGANPADLGCRGPHHAAQLCRSLRRDDRQPHRDHDDSRCRASGRARQAGRGRRRDPGVDELNPLGRDRMSSAGGLHAVAGREGSADAYDRYIGRWSWLAVPSLLAAAEIGSGDRVLDVATGTGEAAITAISLVGDAGMVVGADISAAMLGAARARL